MRWDNGSIDLQQEESKEDQEECASAQSQENPLQSKRLGHKARITWGQGTNRERAKEIDPKGCPSHGRSRMPSQKGVVYGLKEKKESEIEQSQGQEQEIRCKRHDEDRRENNDGNQ